MNTPITQGRFVIPNIVCSQFHLKPGDVVADFGAGSGYFIPALVNAVGEEGVVYAVDVQKNLVEKITNLARTNSYHNVSALWGDIDDENGVPLRANELDAVIMVNTLFQTEDKSMALREAMRTLREGGSLFIIDWSESFAGLGPQPNDVMTSHDTQALAESLGLSFERSFDAGDHHYGLAFRNV